jgi:hypothetical protein
MNVANLERGLDRERNRLELALVKVWDYALAPRPVSDGVACAVVVKVDGHLRRIRKLQLARTWAS